MNIVHQTKLMMEGRKFSILVSVFIEMILRNYNLSSLTHEMGNKLKLVRDFSPFHRNSFKSLRHSDTSLIVNCVDGESVTGSKIFLAHYSKIIRDALREIPNHEELTLILPFKKYQIHHLFDFLSNGQIENVTKVDIESLKCLLDCLGINVINFEEIPVETSSAENSLNGNESELKEEPMSDEETLSETDNTFDKSELELKSQFLSKDFQCGECERSFDDENDLDKHKKEYHILRICEFEYCGKAFRRKMTFLDHIQSKHSENKNDLNSIRQKIKEDDPSSVPFYFLKTGKSHHEGVLISHNGQYLFHKQTSNKTQTRFWYVCGKKRGTFCNARATIIRLEVAKENGHIEIVNTLESISTPEYHNHPPDTIGIIADNILVAMKLAVENDPTTPVARIKEDVLAQELQKYEHDKNLVNDILKELPVKQVSTLNSHRQKFLLALKRKNQEAASLHMQS